MNNNPSSLTYSLVEWLAAGGVATEVAEQPGLAWLQRQKAPAQPEAVPVTRPAQNAPQGPAQVKQAIGRFNDLAALNEFCLSWKEAGLTRTASRSVLGEGGINPRLMVICDLPEDNEDRNGQAFSSPAHLLVRQALLAAGIAADAIYFSYLSKWRTPAKRALTQHEVAFCNELLSQEIGFVQPRAILAMGESTIKVLGGDSSPATMKKSQINKFKNQYLNNEIGLVSSQKGEFLLKNPTMKKSFWFSLIRLAAITRSENLSFQDAPDVNYTE